jgi:hypothetical protein
MAVCSVANVLPAREDTRPYTAIQFELRRTRVEAAVTSRKGFASPREDTRHYSLVGLRDF